MKKILIIAALSVMMVFSAGCSKKDNSSSGVKVIDFSNMSITEIALQYANDIKDENYDRISSGYNYDDNMSNLAKDNQLTSSFKNIKSQYGAYNAFGTVFVVENGAYRTVSIPTKLEKGNVNINVVFSADDKISGVNIGVYQEADEYIMPEGIIEKELELKSSVGGNLPGTLTLPNNIEGKVPCVILIHGSGPNDRDETIYSNKPFRDIAHRLAKEGIAVYRFDKRTLIYAEEAVKNKNFTIEDETIIDAADAVAMLSTINEIDPNKIVVLGHSLGGYAMPRIAAKTDGAAGYIIMAGNVSGLEVLMPMQIEYLAGLDGTVTADEQQIIDYSKAEIEKLKNIDNLSDDDFVLGANKQYFVDLLSYDPIDTAKSIDKPVLVLQGDRDYQVTPDEFGLWKKAYESKANWHFRLYEGLNHLMMYGEGKPNPEEYMTSSHVDQRVINDIATFVKGI